MSKATDGSGDAGLTRGEGSELVAGDGSAGSRAGRFVRQRSQRFMRAPQDPAVHEERGLGWRASWREGAEKLVLQREPVARVKRRFLPGTR